MFGNNPYQPYSYQNNYGGMPNYAQRGYNSQPQVMAQPQPQIQPQMQQPTPQIQDIRYGTEEEAKAFIVFPNASAYFIDEPKGRLYVKTSNNVGASSMSYFALTPINADGTPIKPQEPTPQVDFNQFIKREDLEKLGFVNIEQFNQLAQKFEQIQKRLEGAKANVGQPKQPEARV